MSKFALECHRCGNINTASTFIFAKTKDKKCPSCRNDIWISEAATGIPLDIGVKKEEVQTGIAELVRYSNPMSSEALFELEKDLIALLFLERNDNYCYTNVRIRKGER